MNSVKKLILSYILFMVAVPYSQAQKEYNRWYFGKGAGMNFNTTPPSTISDSRLCTDESSSSICDSNGNLLFYTDGDTIYNRNHQKMLNWKSGLPSPQVQSAEQGSMVLPVPGSNHLYYLIQGLSKENSQFQKDSMMRYRVIDMNGDGGLGEVVVKDQPLFQGRFENFAVARHSNGSDYWVGTIDYLSGNFSFKSRRTTNGLFTEPVMSQNLPTMSNDFGKIKFSPDSRKLYLRTLFIRENGNRYNNIYIHLCKFDNSTGQISAFLPVLIGNESVTYFGVSNAEFSPDSRFLYLEEIHGTNRCIYQYDVSVWDSAIISSSRQLIHSINANTPGYSEFRQFQIGPDGKIYCFQTFSYGFKNDRLSVINFPNLKGTACSFGYQSLQLTKGENNYGGPYYPSFWFKTWKLDLGRDTVICYGDSLQIKSHLQSGGSIKWSTGDTTESIWVKQQGTYSATVSSPFGAAVRDTLLVKIGVKTKVYIGSDTAFCGKFSHTLKAGSGFAKYHWSTGESDVQITVNAKGIYSVKVLDSNMCSAADTIFIDEIPRPVINLSYDSVTCQFVRLSVDTLQGLTYQWNTGEAKNEIKVTKKGWYSVMASHKFCSHTDSVLVDKLSKPEVSLGPDTSLCSNDLHLVLRAVEPGSYLWSTAETQASILVQNPGAYWLKVSRNNCSSSDTILVSPLPVPKVNLGPDMNVCATSVWLSTNDSGKYLWSDQSTQAKLLVKQSGTYWLKVSWGNCSQSDTLVVNLYPVPQVDLGPDTNLCSNHLFLRANEPGNYLWSTMETSPSVWISEPGKYWLKVSNGNCLATDTIDVLPCDVMSCFVPGSFTPNGDNMNDVFRVYGSYIEHVEMEIYNRWGEKLLEVAGRDPYWDGMYQNEPCQESVYFYRITLKGRRTGDTQYLKGTIILLR